MERGMAGVFQTKRIACAQAQAKTKRKARCSVTVHLLWVGYSVEVGAQLGQITRVLYAMLGSW